MDLALNSDQFSVLKIKDETTGSYCRNSSGRIHHSSHLFYCIMYGKPGCPPAIDYELLAGAIVLWKHLENFHFFGRQSIYGAGPLQFLPSQLLPSQLGGTLCCCSHLFYCICYSKPGSPLVIDHELWAGAVLSCDTISIETKKKSYNFFLCFHFWGVKTKQ